MGWRKITSRKEKKRRERLWAEEKGRERGEEKKDERTQGSEDRYK